MDQGSKFIQRFLLLTDIFMTAVALLVAEYVRSHVATATSIESSATFLNSLLFILGAAKWTSTLHSPSTHHLRKLTSPRSKLTGLGSTAATPWSHGGRSWTPIVHGYVNEHQLIWRAK